MRSVCWQCFIVEKENASSVVLNKTECVWPLARRAVCDDTLEVNWIGQAGFCLEKENVPVRRFSRRVAAAPCRVPEYVRL